jgi:hypothetical protein
MSFNSWRARSLCEIPSITSDFTLSGERKFLKVNNVNDSMNALRPAVTTGAFRCDRLAALAQKLGKCSIYSI